MGERIREFLEENNIWKSGESNRLTIAVLIGLVIDIILLISPIHIILFLPFAISGANYMFSQDALYIKRRYAEGVYYDDDSDGYGYLPVWKSKRFWVFIIIYALIFICIIAGMSMSTGNIWFGIGGGFGFTIGFAYIMMVSAGLARLQAFCLRLYKVRNLLLFIEIGIPIYIVLVLILGIILYASFGDSVSNLKNYSYNKNSSTEQIEIDDYGVEEYEFEDSLEIVDSDFTGDMVNLKYALESLSIMVQSSGLSGEELLNYWYTTGEDNRMLTQSDGSETVDLVLMEMIHDYIVYNIKYDTNTYDDIQFDGNGQVVNAGNQEYDIVLNRGTAVYSGYARLFQKMAERCGVECYYISGEITNGVNSVPHAWNVAKVGGEWYNIDCALDAMQYGNNPNRYISYKWFLRPDSYMSSTHVSSKGIECTSNNFEYYSGRMDLAQHLESYDYILLDRFTQLRSTLRDKSIQNEEDFYIIIKNEHNYDTNSAADYFDDEVGDDFVGEYDVDISDDYVIFNIHNVDFGSAS